MKSITTTGITCGLLLLIGLSGWAQAARTNAPLPPPAPRSYLCFDGESANDVMEKANKAGARGWRLVTAGPGRRGSIWCFEQISALRPQEAR